MKDYLWRDFYKEGILRIFLQHIEEILDLSNQIQRRHNQLFYNKQVLVVDDMASIRQNQSLPMVSTRYSFPAVSQN